MSKIFYYELKRMIFSRVFIGMFFVNCLYACFVLSTDIVAGVAYTAPFSVYSFCTYTGRTMSVSIITALLLLAGYFSKKQKSVDVLTKAAPVMTSCQMMLRTAAVGVCFVLICAVNTITAMLFYTGLFRFHDFGAFIPPALLMILPCFVFFAGIGQFLGRFHQGLIYLIILTALAAGFCGVPNGFDLFGAGYFSAYPLTLPAGSGGEPEFQMGAVFVIARLMYLVIGAACFCFNIVFLERKASRA